MRVSLHGDQQEHKYGTEYFQGIQFGRITNRPYRVNIETQNLLYHHLLILQ